MKSHKWLYPHEAEELGFKAKPNEQKRNQARYYLSEEQIKELNGIRGDYMDNIPLTVKGTTTLLDKDGKEVLKWVKKDQKTEDRLNALRSAIDTLKEDIPKEHTVKHIKHGNKKLCNQYTLTDYHLGLMAWGEESGDDWDIKIAENTLLKFFSTAIEQSPNAKECIFAQIGDFLHWDGLEAVTPANKHVLDADTRFTKLVRVAIRVIRKIVRKLLAKYDKVTLIMAEGNHDPASSTWLREVFNAFYEDEPRITVNTNPDPYYNHNFGKVCLFYHHGHKSRLNNIDSVFVSKFKKEYGKAKYVYGHTGHLHHQKTIETNLMILEQHRTLSAKDSYASRGGWSSGRDSKVITYH